MRCQGRPDGKCPDNRNDDTVHNTVADLFLCHACEEYRWPSLPTKKASNGGNGGSGDTTGNKSSRKQKVTTNNVSANTRGKGKASQPKESVKVKDVFMAEVHNSKNEHHNSHDETVNDDICPMCNESVAGEHCSQIIECSCCKCVYHAQCTGLGTEVFQILMKILSSTGWVCCQCKDSYSGLRIALNRAIEEIADMRVSIAWLSTELTDIKQPNSAQTNTGSIPVTHGNRFASSDGCSNDSCDIKKTSQNVTANVQTSSVQLEIHRVLHDAAKRKFNVIVTGLPETSHDGSGSEINKQDCEAFTKFCEENLTVKPPLARKGCIRIGKRDKERPRKLLVHLTSEASAASLIVASKNLQRTGPMKDFYINPDLSRAEAQLAFEQRQKRRATANTAHRSADQIVEDHTDADANTVIAPSSVTGSADTNNDDDGLDVNVTNTVVSRSTLSPTSAEFCPAVNVGFGTVGEPSASTSAEASNELNGPQNPFRQQ